MAAITFELIHKDAAIDEKPPRNDRLEHADENRGRRNQI